MGANTGIEWATHTFNAWEGCVRVSEACRFCYAERRDQQYHGGSHWGPGSTRKKMSESYWRQPLKWNAKAKAEGTRPRVFCSSLADVFEDHPDLVIPRNELFELIDSTPYLNWLILTKRPENIKRLWPFGFYDDLFTWQNIWIGTTVENQEYADKRIPELLKIPAKVRFLSIEPMLGAIDLSLYADSISLVIAGGESGPNARPSHPDWFRSLRDQCQAAGVVFFFKQWGEWVPTFMCTDTEAATEGLHRVRVGDIDFRSDGVITGQVSEIRQATNTRRDGLPVGITYQHHIERDERLGVEQTMRRVGKKRAGRLLDGVEWNEVPS